MKTKEDALQRLEGMIFCTTAMRTTDINGNNENYSGIDPVVFFEDGNEVYLIDNGWQYVGCRHATSKDTDISVWTQEMDERCAFDLEESLKIGKLDIVSFRHDYFGEMDIIVW